MGTPNAFAIAGKIAGLGGLSVALAYLLLRPLIDARVLKTLRPADRARTLRLVVGCSLAIGVAGLSVYAFSIWQRQTGSEQPSLAVGHNATVDGSAALTGRTQIGNDFTVGGDLKLGEGDKRKDDQ
jgi:hypothetical protein